MSKDNRQPDAVPAVLTQDERIAKAIGDALEKALPMAAAVAAQAVANAQQSQQQATAMARGAILNGEKCPECRQLKIACRGKHRRVCALPSTQRHARWFQGYMVNGVRYLSSYPGHLITIPEDLPIEHAIQEYERNEDEMLHGREAFHNSGTIGPNGSSFNPATPNSSWR